MEFWGGVQEFLCLLHKGGGMIYPPQFSFPFPFVLSSDRPWMALAGLFTQDSTLVDHVTVASDHAAEYAATIVLLCKQGVVLATNTQANILAALLATRNRELCRYLLVNHGDEFGLVQLLKALTWLDTPRRIRALKKRISRLKKQNLVRRTTLTNLNKKLGELQRDAPNIRGLSVSGSLQRFVRQWAASIPTEKLEFWALTFPVEPWQQLADLVHLSKDDFRVPWFLGKVFGETPPSGSIAARVEQLTSENVAEFALAYRIPYLYLRRCPVELDEHAKTAIAHYEGLDTVLWYFEELDCPGVIRAVTERLIAGDKPTFPYGKLMERLLYFSLNKKGDFFNQLIPMAELALSRIRLPLEPPVVVFGDASASMDVAIRTSTIICSVLASITTADLLFFNHTTHSLPEIPRTTAQVIEMSTKLRARGRTCPAAALWEYYEKRRKVKCFIIVTDEEENTQSHGFSFAHLFSIYRLNVCNARLVLISFLKDPNVAGPMVRDLAKYDIVPRQFVLDRKRPDLTKLDTILGSLSLEEEEVTSRSSQLAEIMQSAKNFEEALVEADAFLAAESTRPPKEKEKEKEEEEEKGSDEECVICLINPRDTALIECGHLCVCSQCAEAISLCPICRSKVARRVRIFRP